MKTGDLKAHAEISGKEATALRLLQEGIGICSNPFKPVAEECGMSEGEVAALLARLRKEGVIRRFGAVLNHVRAGCKANALLAWNVQGLSPERISRLGVRAARFEFFSHCYLRGAECGGLVSAKTGGKTGAWQDWPWQLYTMLHAGNERELEERVRLAYAALCEEAGEILQKPLVLRTLQEYKKSAMCYF